MKLLSWNVNGIRAASRGGFLDWFGEQGADAVCVQETKANAEQLAPELRNPYGYHSFWHSAIKPGYSGVAIFTKKEPLSVVTGMGDVEIDSEGRVLAVEFKDYFLVSAYFPNSQREHGRLPFKLRFCGEMVKFLAKLREKGKHVVICGDYNIAHRDIDLRNPKTNRDNAGFLPEERAWMDSFLTEHEYVDAFRHFEPGPDHYTWWSYRPGVRAKNVGWRIDYFCVDGEFKARLNRSEHQPGVLGSDHCPILLELKK